MKRATKTLRGITGFEVISQKGKVEKGKIVEYRVTIDRSAPLAEMRIEIEGANSDLAARVTDAIRDELMFRAEVVLVAADTLPRFEMKAQRFVIKPISV